MFKTLNDLTRTGRRRIHTVLPKHQIRKKSIPPTLFRGQIFTNAGDSCYGAYVRAAKLARSRSRSRIKFRQAPPPRDRHSPAAQSIRAHAHSLFQTPSCISRSPTPLLRKAARPAPNTVICGSGSGTQGDSCQLQTRHRSVSSLPQRIMPVAAAIPPKNAPHQPPTLRHPVDRNS